MTTEQITIKLAHRARDLMAQEMIEQTNPTRYIESMRHSLAAWLLVEATDAQLMKIWETYRPESNRN
jgi:hypothetical protein